METDLSKSGDVQPAFPVAGGSLPKFYILEYGHAWNENTLHVFDTAEGREAKTRELIFGYDAIEDMNDEAWAGYHEELKDGGKLRFEGDPGLDWFAAHPARSEANSD
jgi:hypothetical protein